MKRIKKGFTLAEVASALVIIGVVAAIVLPMVTKNIQRQQTGAILGRAVSQIEIGNQNLIQFTNMQNSSTSSYADTLSGAGLLNNLPNRIPAYWGVVDDNNDVIDISNYNGGNAGNEEANITGGTRYVFSKFPAAVSIAGNAGQNINTPEASTGYSIYIDTNGWNRRPNMTGKDIFGFDLLNSGMLIPLEDSEAGDYARQVVEDGFKVLY